MKIREERNMSPIEGGDIIANAIFAQAKQADQYGNPESNEAVDGESDYDIDNTEKSMDPDPLLESFSSFHKEIFS